MTSDREASPAAPDDGATRIFARPDGFYWRAEDGSGERGPFVSLLDATRDLLYHEDDDIASTETLEEAESAIGIADWIDEETGAPGEAAALRLDQH